MTILTVYSYWYILIIVLFELILISNDYSYILVWFIITLNSDINFVIVEENFKEIWMLIELILWIFWSFMQLVGVRYKIL